MRDERSHTSHMHHYILRRFSSSVLLDDHPPLPRVRWQPRNEHHHHVFIPHSSHTRRWECERFRACFFCCCWGCVVVLFCLCVVVLERGSVRVSVCGVCVCMLCTCTCALLCIFISWANTLLGVYCVNPPCLYYYYIVCGVLWCVLVFDVCLLSPGITHIVYYGIHIFYRQ